MGEGELALARMMTEVERRARPRWNGMSVLPATTDIVRPPRHVRFVPEAEFSYM
jgi:hypothetical protein